MIRHQNNGQSGFDLFIWIIKGVWIQSRVPIPVEYSWVQDSTDKETNCFMERLSSRQLSSKGKWVAPLEKCDSLRLDFLFLTSGETRCVSPARTTNWSSPHPRTTVFTSGHCQKVKDVTWPSSSRLSPCVDPLIKSTPSATTTTTTCWLLVVTRRSSNCGLPSPNEISSNLKLRSNKRIPMFWISSHNVLCSLTQNYSWHRFHFFPWFASFWSEEISIKTILSSLKLFGIVDLLRCCARRHIFTIHSRLFGCCMAAQKLQKSHR